ncbi:protein TRACHEARY ELEMENT DIFFERENTIATION-RELATED 7A-like [Penaeus japonicus]|uniref:protein TRACHEARY ELEMENT DIFFERENTIATION-RELATED 7A-like n=1 Tax=Penaeus japonicus TaxID=27405 RepID=UPI001C71618F|nr:protein TRACHEARY ELEMENT DIFFERENTIATION-RELATED 7A-like [Penaeus japonicus]
MSKPYPLTPPICLSPTPDPAHMSKPHPLTPPMSKPHPLTPPISPPPDPAHMSKPHPLTPPICLSPTPDPAHMSKPHPLTPPICLSPTPTTPVIKNRCQRLRMLTRARQEIAGHNTCEDTGFAQVTRAGRRASQAASSLGQRFPCPTCYSPACPAPHLSADRVVVVSLAVERP